MLIALSGPTRPPLSGGQPRHLVILLHGLGAKRVTTGAARSLTLSGVATVTSQFPWTLISRRPGESRDPPGYHLSA